MLLFSVEKTEFLFFLNSLFFSIASWVHQVRVSGWIYSCCKERSDPWEAGGTLTPVAKPSWHKAPPCNVWNSYGAVFVLKKPERSHVVLGGGTFDPTKIARQGVGHNFREAVWPAYAGVCRRWSRFEPVTPGCLLWASTRVDLWCCITSAAVTAAKVWSSLASCVHEIQGKMLCGNFIHQIYIFWFTKIYIFMQDFCNLSVFLHFCLRQKEKAYFSPTKPTPLVAKTKYILRRLFFTTTSTISIACQNTSIVFCCLSLFFLHMQCEKCFFSCTSHHISPHKTDWCVLASLFSFCVHSENPTKNIIFLRLICLLFCLCSYFVASK